MQEQASCLPARDSNWSQNYDKQPNIRYAFGDPLYRWSFASAAGVPDQEARWLYEKEKRSSEPQASSLTAGTGYYKIRA